MKIKGEISVYHLINTLKRDLQIFPPFKGCWLSQFNVLLAGILGVGMGVAGLILVPRDGNFRYLHSLLWTSERIDSSKNLCLVAGLQNLGNNCFLNVILQALASCHCFPPFLQNLIEADDLKTEERLESMPLTVALAALLKDLCITGAERIVVSPRRVMHAMNLYIPSFNLTRQQDAAEALLHLLSSLQDECAECYVPHYGSLADIYASPLHSIFSSKRREGQSERERWQQHFFGPFNGTLGSFLTCRSCSFQLSMDFEFFYCLPLSPVLDNSVSIMDGCTVEDCLKQFTAAEHIENYHCHHCWHIAAMKQLSLEKEENEAKIEKLRHCVGHDSCDCKNLFLKEGLPWSSSFSQVFKQLSIGHCPKILCLQLQRASMSEKGEVIKLGGHISFPPILDLFPFTTTAMGVGSEILRKDTQMLVKQQRNSFIPFMSKYNMQLEAQMLPCIFGVTGEQISSPTLSSDKFGQSINKFSGDAYVKAFIGEECYNKNMVSQNKSNPSSTEGRCENKNHVFLKSWSRFVSKWRSQ